MSRRNEFLIEGNLGYPLQDKSVSESSQNPEEVEVESQSCTTVESSEHDKPF